MAIAFRIMLFVLLFNIAAGILGVALGPYDNSGTLIGYEYDKSKNIEQTTWKGAAAAPGAEGASGWWDKFIDFLRIAFFQKVQAVLDSSVYGILGIFKSIGLMDPAYEIYFYAALSVIYMLGIIDLFTGKKVQY